MSGSMLQANRGLSQPNADLNQSQNIQDLSQSASSSSRDEYQAENSGRQSSLGLVAVGVGGLWDKAKKAAGGVVGGAAEQIGDAVGGIKDAANASGFIRDAKEHFNRGLKTHDETFTYGTSGISRDGAENAVREIRERLRVLGSAYEKYNEYAESVTSISERMKAGQPLEERDCANMLRMLEEVRSRTPINSFMTADVTAGITGRLHAVIDGAKKDGGVKMAMRNLDSFEGLTHPTPQDYSTLLRNFDLFREPHIADALTSDQKQLALQEMDQRLDRLNKAGAKREYGEMKERVDAVRNGIEATGKKGEENMRELIDVLEKLRERTDPRQLLPVNQQESIFRQLMGEIASRDVQKTWQDVALQGGTQAEVKEARSKGVDNSMREKAANNRRELCEIVGADLLEPKFPKEGLTRSQEIQLMRFSMRILAANAVVPEDPTK